MGGPPDPGWIIWLRRYGLIALGLLIVLGGTCRALDARYAEWIARQSGTAAADATYDFLTTIAPTCFWILVVGGAAVTGLAVVRWWRRRKESEVDDEV